MNDLISREEMIRAVDSLGEDHISYHKLLLLIGKMPSAEPERKRGEWMFHIDDLFPEESTQECSVCHEEESIKIQNDNFCPNCGAEMRMRGE